MRFLHTADWQIGMKAKHAGAKADAVRAERLSTVERIVELANRERVDFVVVAGDQFEDAAPAVADIAQVVSVLRKATMPVYVLPGNHDPARTDSPYSSRAWRAMEGGMLVTIRESASYEVSGGVLLAAPCLLRYSTQDPTECFSTMPSSDDVIRVGCAHGTLQLPWLQQADADNQRGGYPIALNASSRAGLAYLALGHWHSAMTFNDGGATIAYSGTPEPTRYEDEDCGTVSIVEIDGPRAQARVRRERVAGLSWRQETVELGSEGDLSRALDRIRAIEEPEHTLLRVLLRGLFPPDEVPIIEAARAELRARFFAYEERGELGALPQGREAWLSAFPPGVTQDLASRLVAQLDGEDAEIAHRALARLVEAVG